MKIVLKTAVIYFTLRILTVNTVLLAIALYWFVSAIKQKCDTAYVENSSRGQSFNVSLLGREEV